MPHLPDDTRTDEPYHLDPPIGWSRVGVAVGAVLVTALLVLAILPETAVGLVEAVADRLP